MPSKSDEQRLKELQARIAKRQKRDELKKQITQARDALKKLK
jgi:hypothetical protein